MKILYHADCTDGSGAALAAWMKLGDETEGGERIEYIPVKYGDTPPRVLGEKVYILDFSYKRDVLMDMAAEAIQITVIDHHKTAKQDLTEDFPESNGDIPLCEIRRTFDMDKSGAVLAWEHFHPGKRAPYLFRLIQDRDLWQWRYSNTKHAIKGLQLTADWREWADYTEDDNNGAWSLISAGRAINDYLEIQAVKILQPGPRLWDIEPDYVPIYNMPKFMVSDTLHMALEQYPAAPYAVSYFDLPDRRVYSLRSRSSSDVDVSEIAHRHGGGGHKHAAGFTVVLER